MADGSARPIEQIRPGERVRTFDVSTGRLEAAEVEIAFEHAYNGHGLVLVNGQLRTAPNHPFYASGGWKRADELRPGDGLITLPTNGDSSPQPAPGWQGGEVGSLLFLSAETDAPDRVYNLEVAGYHNYFAGGILVHNKY
jgi:hypothetical protein